MTKTEKGTLYPDQILDRYYTAEELDTAFYRDHLYDNDSWVLLVLGCGTQMAVVLSVDLEDAIEEAKQ